MTNPLAASPTDELVSDRVSDFVALVKPRITLMILVSVTAGAFLASPEAFAFLALLETLVATAVLASSASALNQVFEAAVDARMVRTAGRPIPTGRVQPAPVLALGFLSAVVSVAYLALRVYPVAALLGAATWAGYVFIYTPLKVRSPLATLIGAVPGALPTCIGWAAVNGTLDRGAWLLFALLFFWQIPHFLGIAWMYSEDYERGGIRIMTMHDATGRRTALAMVLYGVATMVSSLLPPLARADDLLYLAIATVLGLAYLASGVRFGLEPSKLTARGVLLVSVLYLPAVLGALVWSHVSGL